LGVGVVFYFHIAPSSIPKRIREIRSSKCEKVGEEEVQTRFSGSQSKMGVRGEFGMV